MSLYQTEKHRMSAMFFIITTPQMFVFMRQVMLNFYAELSIFFRFQQLLEFNTKNVHTISLKVTSQSPITFANLKNTAETSQII